MSVRIRCTLLSLRDLAVSIGPFALLTVSLLALAYWWLDPNPPKRVVLATGPAQSAYNAFGKRYATALARHGIAVELLPSEGSSDNLEPIRSGKADLGFVQGGSADIGCDDEESIVSLGSLFVEPLWLFYREGSAHNLPQDGTAITLADIKGWRVNVGTAGSGVPRLFSTLLDVNRVEKSEMRLSELSQAPATVAFLDGELDAVVFASAPESLMVQMLLQPPGIKLLDFAQSEAHSRRFGYLTPVIMPQGVVDLAKNIPERDMRLVASTTSLHGSSSWFSRAGEYPSLEHSEVPLSHEAVRAIRNGPPFLQRYLPFWQANPIERMWLVMGLIIALALPLSRIVPPPLHLSHSFAGVPLVRRIARYRATTRNQWIGLGARAAGAARCNGEQGGKGGWCRCRTPTSCARCAATLAWCARNCCARAETLRARISGVHCCLALGGPPNRAHRPPPHAPQPPAADPHVEADPAQIG